MAYTVQKSSTGREEPTGKMEFLIDSSADLADLPEDAAPGSVAYTANMGYMAMKDNSGQWQQIGG